MASKVRRRPPKAWFDRCVRSVSRDPAVDDPNALCGWVWYHHMSPRRALALLRDGRLRYHPSMKAWDKAMRVSGKLLVVEKAKAGLRKGRQAFTDLVEVALNLPGQVFDKLVREGYFTEYRKGTAARRGRSKRGTNIFIMRRG